MKVVLIAEGSYPHVTGGVSTWAQILMENLKNHQFIILAIGAQEKYRGNHKYKLPQNTIAVKEIFLDEMLKRKGRYGKKYRLSSMASENLKNLITGEKVDWSHIFDFMAQKRIKNEMDFFMSINFFDILKEAYEQKFPSIAFTEFFWTVRSMLVPLFFLLKNNIESADLYHSAATGYGGITGAMAKHIHNKPLIITEHGIYSREREEEIIKSSWAKGHFKDMWIKFFYNICYGVYEYADKVITLFEKNRQIQIELGCPENKLQIIPNGIDFKSFAKIADFKKDKAQKTIHIGTVTRVVPIKDIKTMLHSFKIVKDNLKNTQFFIIGPTDENKEYYNECIRLKNRLGLEDVVFTGKTDAKEHIKYLDIMVLTSISEGQPFAILEGMAAKKPFVTTDVGGCSELIYGRNDGFGSAGIVNGAMDVEMIAKSIIKLAQDEDLRKKMGQNGQRRVMEFYGYQKCVQDYKDLYNEFA